MSTSRVAIIAGARTPFVKAGQAFAGLGPLALATHAVRGLIALSGILMRNTLILIGQIRTNEKDGLAPFDAVVEATVQRSRPVILTALAAMLAFIPLTHSVFWGTLAYTLIGGTFGGTVLTLVFLPALYAIWFKIKPVEKGRQTVAAIRTEPVVA